MSPEFWLALGGQVVSLSVVVGGAWVAFDKRMRRLEVAVAELRAQLVGAGLL